MSVKKNALTLLLGMLALSQSACSLASYQTMEALVGGAGGSIAGGGVGYIIGQEIGKKTENTATGAAVGAAAGVALGALVHENNVELSKEREVVVREAKLIDENQKEIDRLREEVNEESNWGRNETKPWNERYADDIPDEPFQGVSLGY